MKKESFNFFLGFAVVFLYLFNSISIVSASEITNQYDSDWGIYTDAQGYNHSQGYSFPETSTADWLPVGAGGHQAYEGYFQIGQTHGNGGTGTGWSQNLICWEGVDWSCVLGTNYDNAIFTLTVGPLLIDDYRNVDSIGFFYQYFCTTDCAGAGTTGYYISAKGRSVSIDSFSAPTQVSVNSSVPISWNTDWAGNVSISNVTGMSCPQSGSVVVDGSMNCTSNGSAGQATITLTVSGPAQNGGAKTLVESKTINVVAGAVPPPPGATECTDPTATNYGGALPCTYPPASTCQDTNATNYGGALPCTYPPADPTYNSQFISQTLKGVTNPGTIYAVPGETIPVTVTYRNTGTATWACCTIWPSWHPQYGQAPGGTKLRSWHPEYGWQPDRVGVSSSVGTNQNHTFSFNITAQATPATYVFTRRMVEEYNVDFGESSPPVNVVVVAPPTLSTNVTLGSAGIRPDGTTNHTVTVTGTNSAGASRVGALDFIINHQGTNAGVYRGAAKWSPTQVYNAAPYTSAPYKNARACTLNGAVSSGGGSAVIWSGWGQEHMTLVSCNVTTSGNSKSVAYVLRFASTYSTPLTGNSISGYTEDTVTSTNTGWQNFLNFSLTPVEPTVNSVTISSPTVIPGNGDEYTIAVTSSHPFGVSNIQTNYALINFQGTDAGQYRGYLTWSISDVWGSNKDKVACAGGGFAAIQSVAPLDVYGHAYIELERCSKLDTGNSRRVDFVVKFNSNFTTPISNNDISGRSTNMANETLGWINFADLFNLNTAAVPTVTSPTSASVTQTGATLGANVTSLGVPASITARGTCWGTTPAPTTNCIPASGLTTGVFTHARTGLSAGTTYYYRGYATNSTGTGYSADGTFTTSAANSVPIVTSPTVSGISASGATLGANVTSLGVPASISERGTCWGTSPAPTTNCTAASGLTTGVFTHARTGMPTGSTIYYRGYATNTTGTGYSADGSFSTSAGTFTLTISSNPSPTGYISSSVGGISCGTLNGVTFTACTSTPITSGTTVVLTALPASSYWQFNGWGGSCSTSGTSPTCTVIVDSNKTVSATFVLRNFNYNEF